MLFSKEEAKKGSRCKSGAVLATVKGSLSADATGAIREGAEKAMTLSQETCLFELAADTHDGWEKGEVRKMMINDAVKKVYQEKNALLDEWITASGQRKLKILGRLLDLEDELAKVNKGVNSKAFSNRKHVRFTSM